MRNQIIPSVVNCLIVDGDGFAAERVESCLTEMPCLHLIGRVADATGAREILARHVDLDLIFIGTGSCNIHAFEIACELRDQVQCMVFTGDDNESALKAFQAGGDHFLLKPIRRSDFSDAIGQLIAKKLQFARVKTSEGKLWIPVQVNNYIN